MSAIIVLYQSTRRGRIMLPNEPSAVLAGEIEGEKVEA
jgi:hypothetical protein